jgi:hypothetical protein
MSSRVVGSCRGWNSSGYGLALENSSGGAGSWGTGGSEVRSHMGNEVYFGVDDGMMG